MDGNQGGQLTCEYKVALALSSVSTRRNGFLQDCSFSLQAAQALLSIWTRILETSIEGFHPITTGGFLDDNNFRCCGPVPQLVASSLQDAWGRSEHFHRLSGTQTNFDKTICFATTAKLQESMDFAAEQKPPLHFKNSFILVGGLVVVRGNPSVRHRNERVQKGICRIRRARNSPIAFQHRSLMLQLGCLPVAIYGCELQTLSLQQCTGLRRAASACMFKGHTWCRAPGLSLTLVLPGHRLDAKQACIYNLLCLNRRLFRRRPDLRLMLEETWRLTSSRHCKGSYGPMRCIADAAAKLKWTWRDPWHFVTASGAVIGLLEGTDKQWKHALRAELRLMVWHEDTLTKRKDMQGLREVDYDATVALYRRSQRHSVQGLEQRRRVFKRDLLDHMQLTHLRTVLTGCIQSRERLFLSNRVTSKLCPFCQEGPETVTHILWHCKSWEEHRGTLLAKYSRALLESLPECAKQCGIVTNAIANCNRKVLALDLQKCFVSILQARDAERKVKGREWLDKRAGETTAHTRQESQPSISALPEYVRLNPANADGVRLFPTYPWSYEHEHVQGKLHFDGHIPQNWRRFSAGSEWTYRLDLFAPLHWYFKNLRWPECSDHTVTWVELALDFMVTTHVKLCAANEESEALSAERAARLFSSASKRLAQICQFSVIPDTEYKTMYCTERVPALTALGLGRAAGCSRRPLLMQPTAVHRMLLQAALEQELLTQSHKRSFVPDLSSLPAPLWTPRSERRRIKGKQSVSDYVPPPSKRKVVRSHKDDVKLIEWSDDEQRLINEAAAGDWRQRARIQKRILHNRTAQSLGNHLIGPFQEHDDLVCMVCGKTTKISNLQRFLKEDCGGDADKNDQATGRGTRASVRILQRKQLVLAYNEGAHKAGNHLLHVPTSLDDVPRCVREECLMTAPNGWRRFGNFTKTSCLGNP